jgi:hypothetical protein
MSLGLGYLMTHSTLVVAFVNELFSDDPDGVVVCGTTDAIAVVELDGEAVARASKDYPGYLDFQPEVHRRGRAAIAGQPPAGNNRLEHN